LGITAQCGIGHAVDSLLVQISLDLPHFPDRMEHEGEPLFCICPCYQAHTGHGPMSEFCSVDYPDGTAFNTTGAVSSTQPRRRSNGLKSIVECSDRYCSQDQTLKIDVGMIPDAGTRSGLGG
jgi:hypothetical protein